MEVSKASRNRKIKIAAVIILVIAAAIACKMLFFSYSKDIMPCGVTWGDSYDTVLEKVKATGTEYIETSDNGIYAESERKMEYFGYMSCVTFYVNSSKPLHTVEIEVFPDHPMNLLDRMEKELGPGTDISDSDDYFYEWKTDDTIITLFFPYDDPDSFITLTDASTAEQGD